MMEKFRRVAVLLPYDKNLKILFQDRREKKRHIKDYGFFGGGVEKGETVEQALAREMMEELEIEIKELVDLEFFRKYGPESREMNISAELNVFLCKMPDISKIKCNEGKPIIIKIPEALNLNISNRDKEILGEIQNYLKGKILA
jgi:8-oxo-dGTP pyrophosphatase MutT (NUDIX family)